MEKEDDDNDEFIEIWDFRWTKKIFLFKHALCDSRKFESACMLGAFPTYQYISLEMNIIPKWAAPVEWVEWVRVQCALNGTCLLFISISQRWYCWYYVVCANAYCDIHFSNSRQWNLMRQSSQTVSHPTNTLFGKGESHFCIFGRDATSNERKSLPLSLWLHLHFTSIHPIYVHWFLLNMSERKSARDLAESVCTVHTTIQ